MPREREAVVTAFDRAVASAILDAVKKKDVEAIASQLAWWHHQVVMCTELRVLRRLGMPIAPETGEAPAVDPRQKEMFDEEG